MDFSDVWCVLLSGWLWYYRRYIDVKKGSVGGLSMLLAGYCVLSYVWSYPHLSECHRQRHVSEEPRCPTC